MNTNQYRLLRIHVALDNGHVHIACNTVFVCNQFEFTKLCIDHSFGNALDTLFAFNTITDQIGNGTNLDMMLFRQ